MQLIDPAAVTEEWTLPPPTPIPFPKELRDASNGFLLPGILHLALGGLGIYGLASEGPNGFVEWVAPFFVLGGILNLFGGFLAARGHPSVLRLAWWALPLVVVVNFPFGTAFGLYTASKLRKPIVLTYLDQQREMRATGTAAPRSPRGSLAKRL